MFGRLCIPLAIAIDFLKPEVTILFYYWWMDRAAMPEAAVKENSNFETRYRKITGAPLQPGQRIVNAIA
jgi:hypothetical protein